VIEALNAIGGLFLVLSLAGSAYAVAAAALARRLAAPAPPPAADQPPVTVLKPLYGTEPGLAEALQSFARQDYGAPVQIICGVQDPDDPALEAVQRLRSAAGRADVVAVVDPLQHGANRKVSNLVNMTQKARHELIVLSDSDIAVEPDYLSRIAAALAEPGVGAVTCYYHGRGVAGGWSRLAAMGVSYGFLPNVLVGVALGAAHPCMGSTIAMRREVLDGIGGYAAFADVLADDYEIGRAVRGKGLKVALPPFSVAHGCSETSLDELVAHEIRWSVTVRLIDPAGHAGSVVTHPVPLALLSMMFLAGSPLSLAALAMALGSRAWLKWSMDRATGGPSGPWSLLFVRDLLSFAVFVGSFFARAVYWRGARFGVSSGRKFFPA
jgi:ceramide glucosyltransferase